MRYNWFHSLLCGLVLAGIIHIIVIMAVPHLGSNDAGNRLTSQNADNRFITRTATNQPILPNADPFFTIASCTFDLTSSGIAVSGNDTTNYWSAAVFSRDGRVLYSLNTRAAIGNRLNMIIAGPVQLAQLRQFQPELLEPAIVVESRQTEGFVLVRVLNHDQSLKPEINDFIKSLSCNSVSSQS